MLALHASPTIYELLALCADAPTDVQRQYEVLTGERWSVQDAAVSALLQPGPKWVLMDGAKPLVAGGFIPRRPGVYQDWLVAVPEAFTPAYALSVTKHCRQLMDEMLRDEAHRIECLTLADRDPRVLKWYGLLGYKFEGQRPSAGANGEDLIAYYRLRAP